MAAANPCGLSMAPAMVSSPVSISVTSGPKLPTTGAGSALSDHMTISITNVYGTQLSLSLASDAGSPAPIGNPTPTVLPDNSPTRYVFPTGWAGRIVVGPNTNDLASKIEGSFTGPPDIDVSYVDGYSVPITCSSMGVPITGCNLDLFEQANIPCDNEVAGPVCRNPAQNNANGPAAPFFEACAGAAYTYPNDNGSNKSDLDSNQVSCCIGTSCDAPLSQQSRRPQAFSKATIQERDTGDT